MPASTLDPVSAALRNSLSKNSDEFLSTQLTGSSRRVLGTSIEFEPSDNYQSTVLTNLKSKYIVLSNKNGSPSKSEMGAEEILLPANRILYPVDAVQLGWNNSDWSVGAGMVNMGNTCYLNSTLQALFHVPALVNWLLSDKQHMVQCEDAGGGQGGCIICAMSKTLQATQQRNTNAIRPWLVYSKLRIVCRHLVPGRQEDAHEFLRYLVEAMERAYIQRFRNLFPLDTRSKETTPLNQILGGYLRSAVRCLECGHVSTTFQHFQDLLLDIRKVGALDDALELYFSREKLDDLAYHCANCQKKVLATKQFSLERAPMVLCIQLKRFSVANNKITKHVTFRQRLELTRFARRKPQVPLVYRLVSLVTHVGQTVGCGHYTAVAQAPSGNFYQFDDSTVRPISHQSVFNTNAYIMLYELELSQHSTTSPPLPSPPKAQLICSKIYNKIAEEAHSTSKDSDSSASSSSSALAKKNNNGVPHQNGLSVPKLPVTAHSSTYNGNGRCRNGNANSDSSDSDLEIVSGPSTAHRTNNPKPLSNSISVNQSVNSSSTSNMVNDGATTSTSATSHVKRTSHSANNALPLKKENGIVNSSTSPKKTNSTSKENGDSSTTSNVSSSTPTKLRTIHSSDTNATAFGSCPSSTLSSKRSLAVLKENGSSSSPSPFLTPSSSLSGDNGNVLKDIRQTPSSQPTSSSTPVQLVPYEVDDSCSSAEESAATGEQTSTATPPPTGKVLTKAGAWQISSTTFHGPSLAGQAGWKQRRSQAVTELMQMSHEGYSAPVSSWVGTRAALDKEVTNDRREDRKRAMMQENSEEKPKCKQTKHNNSSSSSSSSNSYIGTKSNPNYNPFQEHSNARKWQNDSHYYKPPQHNNYNNTNSNANNNNNHNSNNSNNNNNNNTSNNNNNSNNNSMRYRYQGRRGGYHNNRHREKFRH